MAPTTRSATSDRPRPQYAIITPLGDDDDNDDDAINDIPADDEDDDPTYDVNRDDTDLLSPSRLAKSSRSTRQLARTFQLFLQLPPEIRVMIWKMALQPRDPNAHGLQYFTIFQTSGDRKSPLLDLSVSKINRPVPYVGRRSVPEEPEPFKHALGAPRVTTPPAKKSSTSTQYSWFTGNRSLYTAAAGIQFACWESRLIATKVIEAKKAEAAKEVVQRRFDYDGVQCKVQHDAATLLLDVSRKDIFCFDFEQEDSAAMINIKWEKIARHSMFNYRCGLDKVAFEFDVSWLTNLPADDEPYALHQETSPRGFFARVFDAWCGWKMAQSSMLLLIDRTIRVDEQRIARYYPNTLWYDQEDTYAIVHGYHFSKGREKKQMMQESAFTFVHWMKRRKKEMRRRNNPLLVMACLPRST